MLWAVGINVVWAIGWGLVMLALGALLVSFIESLDVGSTDWSGSGVTPTRVGLLLAAGVLVTALLGTALTLTALVLLRLGPTFRTLPSFVQALLAALCALAVATVVSLVLDVVGQLAVLPLSGFSG